MKKILFLSLYYQPDLSAGSFRARALVRALLPKLPPDVHIELITTMPNRYSGFSPETPSLERLERLTIHRVQLAPHANGFLDQALAYGTYARRVLQLTRDQDYALVMATSGRLMTATLGSSIARRKSIPYYTDVRDIFVDTISDLFPKYLSIPLRPALSLVEGYAFRGATKINLISKGFDGYFKKRFPQKPYSYFTNGIDPEFLVPTLHQPPAHRSREFTILYAGNLGEGQGLHHVIPPLAHALEGRARIRIIGSGGRKAQLESALQAQDCQNVEVLPPTERARLMGEYMNADVLFLHLNHHAAFEKVLPSKIFEYAATGKPILAGVSGYAAEFIRDEITNSELFLPCDARGALAALDRLSMEPTCREAFIAKFTREHIMDEMATDILALMN